MAKEKKLTKAEHLEMELNSEQLSNVKLQTEIMLEKKQVKLLKIKLAELENQRTIQALNTTLDNMEVKIKRAEDEVAKFNQKMKEKYKIKSSFGINPDTGIILEE